MKTGVFTALLAATAAALPESNPNIPEKWKRSMENNLEMVRRESGLSDVDILNFALTLEHLENNFYMLGLSMYDQGAFDDAGYTPRLRMNVGEISSDETTHVETLQAALGDAAVPPCTYDFGLTDVKTFMAVAGILEGVGVTAYLGAAALIADPGYLTVAGSILTIEARHSAYLRDNMLPPQSGFPQPFDVPLTAMEAFTLASEFITSCPDAANLGITPFPYLTMAPGQKSPLRAGMWVVFDIQRPTTIMEGEAYAAFITVTGPIFTPMETASGRRNGRRVRIQIPDGVAGQSYVVLTSSKKKVTDGNIIAGPGIVMVQARYTYGGFPQ